jgi:hypothetical protein
VQARPPPPHALHPTLAQVPGDSFSPDSRDLPKGGAAQYRWNPLGRGLVFTRFKFPIVSVTGAEAARLRSLALFNAGKGGYTGFPQYAVRFFFPMGPDGLDSFQCLDAGSCLPLGGQSVWGSIGPLDAAPPLSLSSGSAGARLLAEEEEEQPHAGRHGDAAAHPVAVGVVQPVPASEAKKAALARRDAAARVPPPTAEAASSSETVVGDGDSPHAGEPQAAAARRLQSPLRRQRPVIMAVSPMDSTALFHDLAWGADRTVSSLVALLAAADALSRTDVATLAHQVRIAREIGGGGGWRAGVGASPCSTMQALR